LAEEISLLTRLAMKAGDEDQSAQYPQLPENWHDLAQFAYSPQRAEEPIGSIGVETTPLVVGVKVRSAFEFLIAVRANCVNRMAPGLLSSSVRTRVGGIRRPMRWPRTSA
jgi:hypothetical protein